MQTILFQADDSEFSIEKFQEIQAKNTAEMKYFIEIECPYCSIPHKQNLDQTTAYCNLEKHAVGKPLSEGTQLMDCWSCRKPFAVTLEISHDCKTDKTVTTHSATCRKLEGIS